MRQTKIVAAPLIVSLVSEKFRHSCPNRRSNLTCPSETRRSAPYEEGSSNGVSLSCEQFLVSWRKKKGMLRHMHGYHETLINCGASPPGRAGCFAFCVQALVKLHACQPGRISRWFIVLCETKFFAILRVAPRKGSPERRGQCLPRMQLHSQPCKPACSPFLVRPDVVDRLVFYVPFPSNLSQLEPALKYVSSSRL